MHQLMEETDMTQLMHEPEQTTFAALRTGVVFVPCVICRAPVDLAAVTDANDAPVCGKHFVTEFPPFQ